MLKADCLPLTPKITYLNLMKKNLIGKIAALMCIGILGLSCSPEDGVNGLDGRDGIDGLNGTNGANGLNSLITTTIEQPGTNCQNGGFRLDVGLDANNNGTLDAQEVATSEYLCNTDPTGFSFQSYVALISQSGTDNPTSVVLENQLNLVIDWTRESQGKYVGTLNRNIDIGKTVIFFSTPSTHTGVRGELLSDNQVRLELQNGINFFADDFADLSFELREYE